MNQWTLNDGRTGPDSHPSIHPGGHRALMNIDKLDDELEQNEWKQQQKKLDNWQRSLLSFFCCCCWEDKFELYDDVDDQDDNNVQ